MARTLNILMQNRPDTVTNPGGDTVQMERTAQFLRGLGHRVDYSFALTPDLGQYDIVHLFNLTRPIETHAQAKNARSQRKPYVLSSVYWDLEAAVPWSAYEFPRNVWRRVAPAPVRSIMRRLRSVRSAAVDEFALQKEIVASARFVLPNSNAERDHLLERFPKCDRDKFVVVLNGIDPVVTDSPQWDRRNDEDSLSDLRGALICAGAIGPRKNQLNLVRAMQQLPDTRLGIVGKASPGSARYEQACRRTAGPNVTFHEPIAHSRMADVLRSAKALVQPSYIETPGLAAMEAAALGVPIVVADVPPVQEYFGNLGHYCDPDSPDSIAAASRAASTAPRIDGRAFAERYEWSAALQSMRRVIEEIAC